MEADNDHVMEGLFTHYQTSAELQRGELNSDSLDSTNQYDYRITLLCLHGAVDHVHRGRTRLVHDHLWTRDWTTLVHSVQFWCMCYMSIQPVLLQYNRVDDFGTVCLTAPVGSERRRPSGHWHPTLRPYIAGAPSATLATGSPARRLQDGHICTPVAVWHFTTVPGRRLPSRRRCS